MNSIFLTPIAYLRTPFKEKFGTPRQGLLVGSAEALVEFKPACQADLWLRGLEGFSHVWLISIFHQHLNLRAQVSTVVHPPRLGGRAVGVLASRSPHRPNPLGLTLARVVAVNGRQLTLAGIDLLDGTPILDIKPYVPEADRVSAPQAGWVEENPWPILTVQWSEQALAGLDRVYQLLSPPVAQQALLNLVEETLRLDPRSVADRSKNLENGGRFRRFWIRLYDVDFGFSFSDEDEILIEEVRFALSSSLYAQFENPNQLE